jgi:hypothetical protein
MLAVIAASASIRIGAKVDGDAPAGRVHAARLVRQNAGAVTALGVLALAIAANAVRATRGALGPAAIAAFAVTATLSAVGLAAGREPPPAAAFLNQFGGVLLAGILGWMLGRLRARREDAPALRMLASVALAIALAQAAFGGAIATLLADPPLLLLVLHAASGVAAAACIVALARDCRAPERALLAGVATIVVLIGVACAANASSSALQVAHALAGAVLLAAASYARGRFVRA